MSVYLCFCFLLQLLGFSFHCFISPFCLFASCISMLGVSVLDFYCAIMCDVYRWYSKMSVITEKRWWKYVSSVTSKQSVINTGSSLCVFFSPRRVVSFCNTFTHCNTLYRTPADYGAPERTCKKVFLSRYNEILTHYNEIKNFFACPLGGSVADTDSCCRVLNC